MQVRFRRGRYVVPALALVTGLSLGLAACDDEDALPPPPPQTNKPDTPAPVPKLEVGVYGSPAEVAAYQDIIDSFNSRTDESDASLVTYPDRQDLVDTLVDNAGTPGGRPDGVPDIFLASRADLGVLQQNKLVTPLDALLDERGVDFGDGYSRTAVEAFSADRRLQCVPYGISPMVVYLNSDLVDFGRMKARGLEVPDSPTRWNFDQFTAAASFASRPRLRTKGVYVAPTLGGLAPFVYAGGGKLFDDEQDPASLAFSDDGTRDALQRTLELLRNPTVTLSDRQLAAHPATWWFERGKLGMITADRGLTPRLRAVKTLQFDVMPIPTIDTFATVGDITGLCLSSATKSESEATDLLVHLISSDSVADVVRAGYLVPANQLVALSDEFVQPTRRPLHSPIFTTSIRGMRLPPLLARSDELDRVVGASLRELVEATPTLDLDAVTQQIDEESRTVLDPDGDGDPGTSTETPSPSG